MPTEPNSDVLLGIAEKHLGLIAKYNPYRNFPGVKDRQAFAELIANDPAFAAFGFGDDRYVVARIGGNLITSLHKKIGDMYEEIFRYLLTCRFDLTMDDLRFSVDVITNGRTRARSTDGLLPQDCLSGMTLPLPDGWAEQARGVAFELRSCYQIGDSKRKQADKDIALALKTIDIIPVMLIFCGTSLRGPVQSLRGIWYLFEGQDTFEFIRTLTGFDLFSFMQANRDRFSAPIAVALAKL